jgi:hypothetical protein
MAICSYEQDTVERFNLVVSPALVAAGHDPAYGKPRAQM